jgi:uncharacterized protein
LNPYRCLFLAGLLLVAARSDAAETPIPPAPTRWVTDTANFMSAEAADALNAQLQSYERSTGHQLIVWIGPTTGDAPIDDWAVRAFASWKIGRKGLDDGIALFIMSADRRLRIEVGYGLEGQIPDAMASRIINDVIVPRIQAGDNNGAVIAGMDAVMQILGGGGLLPEQGQGAPRQLRLGQLLVYAILGIVFLFLFATNPTLAVYILASVLSGGHRRGGGGWGGGRGGGFGGGGFGGGGGRSGGGGASGSW